MEGPRNFAAAVGVHITRPAVAAELALPTNLPEEKFTFDDKGVDGWTTVSGQWAVEEMAGAPAGKRCSYTDRMQAWLNGVLLLDHRDARVRAGRVGLWTKADSITAFDDLTIRGVTVGG